DAPSGAWWIRAVRIYGSRYGGGYDPAETTFSVSVTDDALKPLATVTASYDRFELGHWDWVEVEFDEPVKVPSSFRVVAAFDPTARKGVYVAYSATASSHSGYGLAGGDFRPYDHDKEWMIRAVLTDEGEAEEGEFVELAWDSGEMRDKRSLGGSGHVLEFKKPAGKWWLHSVRVYGLRYGGGYDPAVTPFTVSFTRSSMKAFHVEEGTYAAFPSREFRWVEIPVRGAVRAPSQFRVAVDFDPSQTRGVYVGFSTAERTHAYTGRAGGRTRRFADGEWMIRVVLTKTEPEAFVEEAPPRHDAATYLADLDFIAETVAERFPALDKKGVDWDAVVASWRPRFEACPDDATHVLNVHQLLATLGDSHTTVTGSRPEPHVPSFDGLYGAGLWIAADRNRFVLRALMPGHPLADRLSPGAALLTVGGRPAGLVHAGVAARLATWHGWSSPHFRDARLSFQFFPFDEGTRLPATFLDPDGREVEVVLSRWGPGGRGLSRQAVTLPAGLEPDAPAVSRRIDGDLGYVRILGAMNDVTQDAFFAALEDVKDAPGIVLDCRGMGGGGDGAAWAMAGRFFTEDTPLDPGRVLEPSGDWSFTGPVVMLQDEREVSSAETFTWAMVETGRVVSVGRPTGGATIIPTSFELPSELVRFRMGVHDRKTPILRVQPEGIGTPPAILVPYDPVLLADGADPIRDIGLDVLRRLVAGDDRETVIDAYAGALGADAERLRRARSYLESEAGLVLRDRLAEIVEGLLAWEVTLCEADANPTPDFAGAAARIDAWEDTARALGLEEAWNAAKEVRERWEAEIPAHQAYEAMIGTSLTPEASAVETFLSQYAETRYGKTVRRTFGR
ncbi:MAG: S41 family peptidase, partial [Planctomycetota bacterium]